MNTPLFRLGAIYVTPTAQDYALLHKLDLLELLTRHETGDFGDLSVDDALANLDGMLQGGRIFSSYAVGPGKVWIITEANRSTTTILLPSDY